LSDNNSFGIVRFATGEDIVNSDNPSTYSPIFEELSEIYLTSFFLLCGLGLNF